MHPADDEKKEDILYLNDVGQLYRMRGNTTLAIECFRRALAMVPDDRRVVRAVLMDDRPARGLKAARRAVRVVAMAELLEAPATIRSRALRETARSSVGSYPVADVRNELARKVSVAVGVGVDWRAAKLLFSD